MTHALHPKMRDAISIASEGRRFATFAPTQAGLDRYQLSAEHRDHESAIRYAVTVAFAMESIVTIVDRLSPESHTKAWKVRPDGTISMLTPREVSDFSSCIEWSAAT